MKSAFHGFKLGVLPTSGTFGDFKQSVPSSEEEGGTLQHALLPGNLALQNRRPVSISGPVVEEVLAPGRSMGGPFNRVVADLMTDESIMRRVTERDSFKELMVVAERIPDDDQVHKLLTEGSVDRTPREVETAAVDRKPADEDAQPETPRPAAAICQGCLQVLTTAEYSASGHAGNVPGPDPKTQRALEMVWVVVISLTVAAGLINLGKVKAGHKLAAFVWDVASSPMTLARVFKRA
eukprot:TRINITY_DN847_c0_g2_i1.p1 TRINITY_DN847_c0_g2~~TRINITY_DN847_c0_g2_i1.p1  ORF type:complete len:237 (+),score=50.35 TRINITY_DN847_c0_g2_i1:114-824(+)